MKNEISNEPQIIPIIEVKLKIKSPKIFIIYKHTNVINGKYYIGLTYQTIEKRWKQHVKNAHSPSSKSYNCLFMRAIRKYEGEEYKNVDEIWKHEIIEENIDSLEKANELEVKWIAELKANNSEFGYNITAGGYSYEYTDEAKEKLRKINKGKGPSPENVIKIANKLRGRKKTPEEKAKHLAACQTPEFREKARLNHLGKTLSEETRNKMSIAQLKVSEDPEALKKRRDNINSKNFREKSRLSKLGKHHTDETRAKMKESAKTRLPQSEATKLKRAATISTPEFKEKIRIIKTGKKRNPHTPEAKAKMSIAQKKRFERERAEKLKQQDEQIQLLPQIPDILITK